MISISRWPTSGSGRHKESVSTANWPGAWRLPIDRRRRNLPPSWRGTVSRDKIMREPYRISSRPQQRLCAGMRIRRPSTTCGEPALLETLPDTPERLQQSYTCMWRWVARSWLSRARLPRRWNRPIAGRMHCVNRSKAPLSCCRCSPDCGCRRDAGGAPDGEALGQRLLTLAERHQDRAFLLEAHVALGGERFFLGQFDAALVHLQQGMAGEDVPAPPRPGLSITPGSAATSLRPGCCGASAILTRPWPTVRKLSPGRNACRTLTC